MKTLVQFSKGIKSIPLATGWYLSDLSEAKGKQELFTKQAPQKLKVLREHALIESAVSSNRIEGVNADKSRIGTLVFGKPDFRDRNEEEIKGYRDALTLIHSEKNKLKISETTIKKLHKMCRGEIWDAGKYKQKNIDIIQKYNDGTEKIRFKTVSANQTADFMKQSLKLYNTAFKEKWAPPLIITAAFNFDFLCVHPFRDGNGRVSRLLWLLSCYHLGFDVGRFISLERIIEENKEQYYEALELSSVDWHKGKHNPWYFINYTLYILKLAYKEFEQRVNKLDTPKGAKTVLIIEAIKKQTGEFTINDIEKKCPAVGRDWIKKQLAKLKNEKIISCKGKGTAARWFLIK
jgi:Fic family protein